MHCGLLAEGSPGAEYLLADALLCHAHVGYVPSILAYIYI